VLRAYANLCDLLDLTGELERAAALAQRGVEEARQHGLERPFGAWFTADAAAVPLKLGRVGTALSACLGVDGARSPPASTRSGCGPRPTPPSGPATATTGTRRLTPGGSPPSCWTARVPW
jgi:hypothetical protein